MKKVFLSLCLVVMSQFLNAQTKQRKEISGSLEDSKTGNMLGKWRVINKTADKRVKTDKNGNFKIEAREGDTLLFQKRDETATALRIETSDYNKGSFSHSTETKVSATSDNYWFGATLGYNLAGKSIEDVVGSAKVVLNPLNDEWLGGKWGIIGNFSNFQGSVDKSEIEKSVRKITQTEQGLFVGIGSIWTEPIGKKINFEDQSKLRFAFSSGARLNSFTNIGVDSSTADLLQFRNSLGAEFEGGAWKNGGKLTFSVDASVGFFTKSDYKKIFNEDKTSIFVLDASAILPASKNMGILVSSTFTPKEKPTFMLGIIFKTSQD